MEALKFEDRLKNVLVSDKQDNPLKVVNVIKSDILKVLQNYMNISSEDLDVNITVDEYGNFIFNSYAKVRRLKSLSAILD